MSVRESANAISAALKKYHELINSSTEEDFLLSPADGGWSCSEVLCHIAQANLGSLIAIERCIHGKAISKEVLPIFTRIILFLGRFPIGRYKAPASLASIVKKISREEARNQLIRFSGKLDEILPKINKCSPYCRVKHPRLGMLNAEQWLRFIEIHSNHHLKQIKRIKKGMPSST